NPWEPMNVEAMTLFREPAYELVSIRRISQADNDDVVYRFAIGNVFRRVLHVTFNKSLDTPFGLFLKEVTFKKPVVFAINALGEETHSFTFYAAGRAEERTAVFAKVVTDPQGQTVTPADQQVLARFTFGHGEFE
ncbi:MAG TPA: hypothetical protein VIL47_01345, partial [Candidatus Bipolaricaulota bacterium]